jgi:hypothetical protein
VFLPFGLPTAVGCCLIAQFSNSATLFTNAKIGALSYRRLAVKLLNAPKVVGTKRVLKTSDCSP